MLTFEAKVLLAEQFGKLIVNTDSEFGETSMEAIVMNELISVVIPAHNTENYVSNTIASVLAQTYEKLEIIVVDDGSTDDTVKRINDSFGNDSRVRVIKQENRGVSAARNTGIENAEGEFIAFLDSDDLYHPTFIEKMVELLRDKNAETAFCAFKKVSEKGVNIFLRSPSTSPVVSIRGPDFLLKALKNESSFSINATVFSKSLIDSHELRFVNGAKNGQDAEFIWKSIFHSDRVVCTNEVLASLLDRHDSLSKNPTISKLHAAGCCLRTFEYLKKHKAEESIVDCFEKKTIPSSFTSKIYFFVEIGMPKKKILEIARNKNYRSRIKKAKKRYFSLYEYLKILILLLSPSLAIDIALIRSNTRKAAVS